MPQDDGAAKQKPSEKEAGKPAAAPPVIELAYKLFGLSLGGRLALFVVLALAGILIQFLLYFPGHRVLGFLIIAFAGIFMIGTSYTKVPKDLGFEEWRPVTENEFDRLLNNFTLMKKAKIPLVLRKKPARVVFFILAFFLIIFMLFLYSGSRNALPLTVVVDALLLLYPLFLSGNIQVHAPKEMEMKLDRFKTVIEEVKKTGPGTAVTPYFRFDKDSAGKLIPEDVRLMLEPKRRPADLIGAQLQISINKGPSGNVPYMYAVVLAQEEGPSFPRLKRLKWRLTYQGRGRDRVMISEEGKQDGFGYVVVRQPTDDGGYETTREQCIDLARLILHGMKELSE
jgi:hypothetical protein